MNRIVVLFVLIFYFNAVNAVKIYDCFTFNGEWDYLKLRLSTHLPLVEKFIVIESAFTFSGKPKRQELLEELHNIPWLYPFADKLIVRGVPQQSQNAWDNERAARRAWKITLSELNVQDDDWVLIGDLDMIWKPQLGVQLLDSNFPHDQVWFPCEVHYYHYATRMPNLHFGLVSGFRWKLYRNIENNNGNFGDNKGYELMEGRSGCWHCSYCFGPTREMAVSMIQNKLLSFAHVEYSGPPYTDAEYIIKHIEMNESIFGGAPFGIYAFDDIEAPPLVYVDRSLHYLISGFDQIPQQVQSLISELTKLEHKINATK